MSNSEQTPITVSSVIHAPLKKVWEKFTMPEHITKWNFASDDWHTPRAENDFREGGKFSSRMESKDGTMGFEFSGTNAVIRNEEYIEYLLDDTRKVAISFSYEGDAVKVEETFDAESTHSAELQQQGWQAVLDNFRKYCESSD